MGVTPAYLESVASFYDLFTTRARSGEHQRPRLPQHLLLDARAATSCSTPSARRRAPTATRPVTAARARPTARSSSRASSAWAPATSRRWPRSTSATTGRSRTADAATVVEQLRAGAEPVPDKALAPAHGRRRPRRAGGSAARGRRATVPETRVLFRDIDEPGLATIEGYRRRGGYRSLRAGVPRARARSCSRRARGLRPPRPRRRRLLDGQEGLVPAPRRHGQVPLLQRRRVRARHVQGPRADAEEPAPADRGHRDRGARGRARRARSSSSAASTGRSATSSTRAVAEAYEAGFLGENVLGSGDRGRARRPPRRRRLHLRRGDRAARLARGQARQPAPEAAVPGDPGPLRRADADQQRRDADRTSRYIVEQRRRLVQGASAPSSRPAPRWSRSPAACSGPGNYEIELGIPSREIIYGLAGGPPEGREVKAWYPGRLLRAGADRRRSSTSPTASRRSPTPARCSAPARSSSPTTPSRSPSWRCGPRASTTTSPAASAPPAARARTGR